MEELHQQVRESGFSPTPLSSLGRAIPFSLVCLLVLATHAEGQQIPAARAHHELVYHAGEGRVYLIGGSTRQGDGSYGYFDDVWYLDDAGWVLAGALPFPRSSHRVWYDEQRESLILFGGGFAQAVRAEGVLWEWREASWRALDGNHRAGTAEPEICYDRSRNRAVIFGGWDAASNFRPETWEWQDAGLVLVDSAGPSARAGHVFAYDPVRQTCLLFGGQGAEGYLSDTWVWNGHAWRRIDTQGPPARWFPGYATDPTNARIVVFGGRGPDAPVLGRDASGDLADTWVWTGQGWNQLQAPGPSARMGAKIAYTGTSLVLFGGRVETAGGFEDRNDSWVLTGSTWQERDGTLRRGDGLGRWAAPEMRARVGSGEAHVRALRRASQPPAPVGP